MTALVDPHAARWRRSIQRGRLAGRSFESGKLPAAIDGLIPLRHQPARPRRSRTTSHHAGHSHGSVQTAKKKNAWPGSSPDFRGSNSDGGSRLTLFALGRAEGRGPDAAARRRALLPTSPRKGRGMYQHFPRAGHRGPGPAGCRLQTCPGRTSADLVGRNTLGAPSARLARRSVRPSKEATGSVPRHAGDRAPASAIRLVVLFRRRTRIN